MKLTSIMGQGNRPAQVVAGAFVYFLATLTASGQDLYGCERPIGMPPAPDGYSATLHDMQAACEAVEAFISEGQAYIDCLARYPDSRVVATIRDQIELQMDLAAVRFNDALCASTSGEQCARTRQEANVESTSSYSDQVGAATPEAYVSNVPEGSRAADPYLQPNDVGPATGSQSNEDLNLARLGEETDYGISLQDLEDPGFPLREPTLPDGTPCGSIMQSRNDAMREGPNLRARYAWEVYNACFDPILVRWTFRGDGLLNARHTIPARGFQIVGCSTTAGTTSGTYSRGGIDYAFEWP